MKKRIWISALLLCVCVLALFSCKNRGDKNDQNQGTDGNAYYTVVFEYNDLGLSVAEKIRDKLSSI